MGEGGGVVRMRHWWWWGGAFTKCEAGEGGWGQKAQTEPLGLDFGRAVGNGGGERWGEVVGRRIRGGDGVGAPGSRNARLGGGGGGAAYTRWRRRRDAWFAKCEAGGGSGQNPQTSCRGLVWGWVRAPSGD